jgi:homoserine dehydrogenase
VSHARADLALIGYGNVAKRFVTLLDEQRGWLAREYDLDCRIVGVATRTHGARFDSRGINFSDLNRDGQKPRAQDSMAQHIIGRLGQSAATLRVVIETTTLDIRGGQPAIDHVRAGIAAGCHVVTANKGPVAFAYSELRDAAAAAGVSFLFEGAVMDGIPIFNLVRETLPAVEILGFRGVINSTTNHILSALERGERFDSALARMQAEGIAEADPSLDVDGWDAAAKAAALANVFMDARITPHDVRRQGIGPADGIRAQDATARGRRLKLVASAARDERGAVTVSVEPVELARDDLLADLDGKANALVLRTDLLGELAICQLEGNLTHTAYALLSDLVTVRRRQRARGEAPARRIP